MGAFATIVTFIALHGGPAEHFGVFGDALQEKGVEVHFYASGPALSKLQGKKMFIFFLYVKKKLSESLKDVVARMRW